MLHVVERAPAKVNLALHVRGRRQDGYHELSSVVAFADVADVLNLAPAANNALTVSGRFAGDVPLDASNIIWKAYRWLSGQINVPPVVVKLQKNLPVAAGIGGGSADAGALLRGLLRMTQQTLSEAQINSLATELGADVPVCFRGVACTIEGIGEIISPLTIKLPAALVLVNSGQACSTHEVFTRMGLQAGQAFKGGVEFWRNDMTKAALKVQPAIGEVLAALGQSNLETCLMSGSGATCFGAAPSLNQAQVEAQKLKALHPTWWVRAARLLT